MSELPEDALADELKSLVGWGVTPDRLSRLPILSALPSVASRVPVEATGRTRGLAIRLELTACLEALSGDYELPGSTKRVAADQIRQAGSFLLALTGSAQALSAPRRRERAIQTLSLSATVTVDTWRRPDGLELSFMRLLAHELLKRGAQTPDDPGYRVVHFTITAFLTDRGVLAKQEIVQDIASERDGLDRLTNRWIYPTDRREGMINVTPLLGCELVEAAYSQDRPGLVTATLSFPQLHNGERHMLGYSLTMQTDKEAEPHLSYEPGAPVELLTMRLRFSEKRLPRRVWWFAGISAIAVPGEPTSEITLPINAEGWYSKEFHRCHSDKCYGLAWRFS